MNNKPFRGGRSEPPVSGASLAQSSGNSRDQIHAFVEDGHDQGGCPLARQAEDIVMFAASHAKAWVEVRHVAKMAIARSNGLGTGLEAACVLAGLRLAPLT